MRADTLDAYRRIWEALDWEEFKDARAISDEAGVPRGRTCEFVRGAVRWMRDRGLPVVSRSSAEDGSKGFKKSANPAELASFITAMHRRARATYDRAERMLAHIELGWGATAYEEDAGRLFRPGGRVDEEEES